MKKLTCAFMLVLGGCSPQITAPNYSAPTGDATVLKANYETCIKKQTPLLDDGTSPANVIAAGVANACNSDYIAYSMSTVAADNDAVKRQFYQQLTYDRNLAIAAPMQYVLSRRQYLAAHPKNNAQ